MREDRLEHLFVALAWQSRLGRVPTKWPLIKVRRLQTVAFEDL